MNCPICGAPTTTLLCKNCEAKNDKINNWFSTYKSNVFAKETKISLYLSKFTIQGEGYISIEKIFDSEAEGIGANDESKRKLTQKASASECEAFEFSLVHITDVSTTRFNGQNSLLIKLTHKVDKFIEFVSLYLPGLPDVEEIASVIRQSASDAKDRAQAKSSEYKLIKEKEDAEFFLKKYNEYIEKANFPSLNIQLADNNLKGIYLDRDNNIVFIDISGVERTVRTAYIPFKNVRYFRRIVTTPKYLPEEKEDGFFGGTFVKDHFDIDSALHDYVLLYLPGQLPTDVPVLPDAEYTFSHTKDATYASAGNILLNYYNPKLRYNFDLELPAEAFAFFQQHFPQLDFTLIDQEYGTRQAIADKDAQEARAILDEEKQKALEETQAIKQHAAEERAAALKEAEEAKATAMQEAEQARQKAEQAKVAAMQEAEQAKAAALKEAEEAKAAAMQEAEQARQEAEQAKAAALKEANALKEAALREAEQAKEEALRQAQEAAQAALKEANALKEAALKEAEQAKAAAMQEAEHARQEAEQAKAAALRQAALDAISQQEIEAEQARIAEEERKRKEAEQARIAEEERKRKEAEQARIAEEERKRKEAEQARIAEEEHKRKEAETLRLRQEFENDMSHLEKVVAQERAERLEEERIAAEKAEKLRIADEKARQEARERERLAQEEQARKEQEELEALEAQRKAQQLAQEQARKEQEERERQKLEEQARLAQQEEIRREQEKLEQIKATRKAEEERIRREEEEARIAREQAAATTETAASSDIDADALESAAVAAQEALADAQAERDALIKESNQKAEQAIKKPKLSLKSDDQKAEELQNFAREQQRRKEEEDARHQSESGSGKRITLSLAGDDNYLSYKNDMEAYMPGAGITGAQDDLDPDAESLSSLRDNADDFLQTQDSIFTPDTDDADDIKTSEEFSTEKEGSDDLDSENAELSDFEVKIRKLKIMLDHELITEEEFKTMKADLLSNI